MVVSQLISFASKQYNKSKIQYKNRVLSIYAGDIMHL